MKKKLILLALIFSSAVFCFSVEFKITPYFSEHFGWEGEYVFYPYSNGNGGVDYLKYSYLEWDQKALPILGVAAECSGKIFGGSIDVNFGIPGEYGVMQDSDWFNAKKVSSPSDVNEKTYLKSCYTVSTSKIDGYFNAGGKVFWKINPLSWFRLDPFVEAYYTYTHQIAYGLVGSKGSQSGGYYTEWNDNPAVIYNKDKYPDTLKVVELERYWGNLWIGLDVSFLINTRFEISLSASADVLTGCLSFDTHWLRDYIFKDTFARFFTGFKIGGDFAWNITGKDSVSLGAQWKKTGVIRGNTSTANISSPKKFGSTARNVAGADFDSVEIKLSYTRKI